MPSPATNSDQWPPVATHARQPIPERSGVGGTVDHTRLPAVSGRRGTPAGERRMVTAMRSHRRRGITAANSDRQRRAGLARRGARQPGRPATTRATLRDHSGRFSTAGIPSPGLACHFFVSNLPILVGIQGRNYGTSSLDLKWLKGNKTVGVNSVIDLSLSGWISPLQPRPTVWCSR